MSKLIPDMYSKYLLDAIEKDVDIMLSKYMYNLPVKETPEELLIRFRKNISSNFMNLPLLRQGSIDNLYCPNEKYTVKKENNMYDLDGWLKTFTPKKEKKSIMICDMEFTDISSELYRIYHYPDKSTVRINEPLFFNVSKSGSHRLIDSKGMSHWVKIGFNHIEWHTRSGKPYFVK